MLFLVDKSYRYFLVEFVEEKDSKGKQIIEAIPRQWTSYDEEVDTYYAFYPPPPYDEKKIQDIRILIKKAEDFQMEWDAYPIDVKGRASECLNIFYF